MSRRKQSHPKSRKFLVKENIEEHNESFDLSNSKPNCFSENFNQISPNKQLMIMMKEVLPINENPGKEKRESTKRKCSNSSTMIPTKRLCSSSNPSFDRPVQIGRFIYVPIPVMSPSMIHRPFDLRISKSDEDQLYQCQFCSIRFRLRETLQAHQENYCLVHQKQKSSPSDRTLSYTCRLCHHRETHLNQMHIHLKYHLFHGQSCSEEDILCQSLLFKCLICSAMFDEEDNLLDHIRCIHVHSKLIQCLECRSKFSSKWNLIRHMKILHTNIHMDSEETCLASSQMRKNYCSFCQISFRQESSYRAHRLFYCAEKISS